MAAWLLTSLLAVGCVGKPTPNDESPAPSKQTPAETALRDVWDVQFVQDSKIGYRHLTVRQIQPAADGSQRIVRSEETSLLKLKRFGETTETRLQTVSDSTLAGELLEFRYDVALGATPTQVQGVVRNGQLELTATTGDQTKATNLNWPDDARGYFGIEESLLAAPLEPGERRRLTILLPLVDQLATIDLHARGHEAVALLAGTYDLLRIEQTIQLSDGTVMDLVLWTDPAGEILKTWWEAMQQTTYRTTRPIALEAGETHELDFGTDMIVRLAEPFPIPAGASNVHGTRKAVYELHLANGQNPVDLFKSQTTSTIQPVDAHTARLEVRAVRPDSAPPEGAIEGPVDGDRQASSLVQAADPAVVKLAESVADNRPNAWEIAAGLERLVHEHIREKDFSQVFASAAEVAVTRRGDCTEHAVLLAALCRARGIPARVALGLVYHEPSQGFAYHMWNEVWIDDRWIPLDATLGQAGIGAAHLKLLGSNLQGASAYSAAWPVLQILGKLQIKVLEAH